MKPIHHQPVGPENSHSEITPTITKLNPEVLSQECFFGFWFPPSSGDTWTMSGDSFSCYNGEGGIANWHLIILKCC